MFLYDINSSTRNDKKYAARFCHCKNKGSCQGSNMTVTHFGAKHSKTYIDHGDDKKREDYIKRHKVNEDFNKPMTAGALSRWLLWGDYTNLKQNISAFKKRFNI